VQVVVTWTVSGLEQVSDKSVNQQGLNMLASLQGV